MVDIVELPLALRCDILETKRRMVRFDVSVSELGDGNVDRNLDPDFAWYRWELQFVAGKTLNLADAQEAEAFLVASRLGAYAFLYDDIFRNTGTNEPIGTSDGTTNQFQLYKVYSNGVRTYLHPIKHPTAGTVGLSIAGTPVNITLGAGGVVTVTDSPVPTGAVTATFQNRHAVIVEPGTEISVSQVSAGWRIESFAVREVIEA